MNNWAVENAKKDLKKAELIKELFEESANVRKANGRIELCEFGIYYDILTHLIWSVERAEKEFNEQLEKQGSEDE